MATTAANEEFERSPTRNSDALQTPGTTADEQAHLK